MIRTFFSLVLLLAIAPAFAAGDSDSTDKPALQEVRAKAEHGDSDAQLNIGALYFKGEGVPQDYSEAAKWFRMAGQKGNAQAQFNMGMLYDTGHGVGLDHAAAVRWYKLAAKHGLSLAQLNLGVAYAQGQGIEQNEALAVKWLSLSADQGEAQAQFNLGVMYANGQGVQQDLVTSYRYARLAAAQGHETAVALMRDLVKKMSPEQLVAANQPVATNTPSTAPPVEMKPLPATASNESPQIYLQMGAFKSENQASKFMSLLGGKLSDTGKSLSLYTQEDFVRILLGPYESLSEAKKSAVKLKGKLGFEPMTKMK